MSDPVRAGRPEAAAVIWDWRGEADDSRHRAKHARRGALIRFVVASAAGAIFFVLHRPVAASIAGGIGTLTLILALASPLGAYAKLDRVVTRAGELVGTVFTWVLLAPVFYLFFTPFGFLFRRGARDPMKRRFEPSAPTYWKKRADDRADLERPY